MTERLRSTSPAAPQVPGAAKTKARDKAQAGAGPIDRIAAASTVQLHESTLPPSPSDADWTAQECFSAWLTGRKDGKTVEADAILARAVQRFPEGVRAFEHGLEALHKERGRADDELAGWNIIATAYPNRRAAWRRLPTLLAEAGELNAAEAAFRKACALPDPPEIWKLVPRIARSFVRAGEVGRAIAIIRDAIELVPDQPSLWHELAAALRAAGDSDGASAILREALERFPDDLTLKDRLSRVLQGKAAHAAEVSALLQDIAAQSPQSLDLRLRLADAHGLAGDAAAARVVLEAAVATWPEDARPAEKLAKLTERGAGGLEAALPLWQTLAQRFPEQARHAFRAAQLARRLGQLEDSLQLSRAALIYHPTDGDLVGLHVQSLRRLESAPEHRAMATAERHATVSRAMALDPGSLSLAREFVAALQEQDRESDAYRLLLRNVRRHPRNAEAHLMLARFAFNVARYDVALRQCRMAIDIDPGAMPARMLLSHFLLLQGRAELAIEVLNEAPDSTAPELRLSLAQAKAEQVIADLAVKRWEAAAAGNADKEPIVLRLMAEGDIGGALAGLRALGKRGRRLMLAEIARFYGHAHPGLEVLRRDAIRNAARTSRDPADQLRLLRWAAPVVPGHGTIRTVARLRQRFPENAEVLAAADAVEAAQRPAGLPVKMAYPPSQALEGRTAALFAFREAARATLLGEPRLPPFEVLAALPSLRPVYAVLAELVRCSFHRSAATPPRVALCVSGEQRELGTAWPTIRERLVLPLAADVFLHTWTQPGGAVGGRMLHHTGPIRHLLRRLPPDLIMPRAFAAHFPAIASAFASTEVINAPQLQQRLALRSCEVEAFSRLAPLLKSRPVMPGFAAMTYGIAQAERLMRADRIDYDVVVRVRPDLIIDALDPHEVMDAAMVAGVIAALPFEPTRGVSDQFAAGSAAAMRLYAAVWHAVEAADAAPWLPGQNADTPEGLLGGHLFACGIEVRSLRRSETRLARPSWQPDLLLSCLAQDLPRLPLFIQEAVMAGVQYFARALVQEALRAGLAEAHAVFDQMRQGFAGLPGAPFPWLAEAVLAPSIS